MDWRLECEATRNDAKARVVVAVVRNTQPFLFVAPPWQWNLSLPVSMENMNAITYAYADNKRNHHDGAHVE